MPMSMLSCMMRAMRENDTYDFGGIAVASLLMGALATLMLLSSDGYPYPYCSHYNIFIEMCVMFIVV